MKIHTSTCSPPFMTVLKPTHCPSVFIQPFIPQWGVEKNLPTSWTRAPGRRLRLVISSAEVSLSPLDNSLVGH